MTLPVTVVGGYLGAGKTTLVNHLLRHAGGVRLAVLVNDFGDLPIDADLIESEDDGAAEGDGVIAIAGGCVCCSFGSDLMTALATLTARTPPPDHILIETSGVALPDVVARSITLLAGLALDGVVVLADAETILARAADGYMGDTIERQMATADLIVLNKTDLVAPAALAAIRARWNAVMIDAVHARVPIDVVLGAGLGDGDRTWSDAPLDADANARYDHAVFDVRDPLDVSRLAAALTDPMAGVIRAKGVLNDRDGSPATLQIVGARYAVTPAPQTSRLRGLVCIGLKGRLDHAMIERAVADASTIRP